MAERAKKDNKAAIIGGICAAVVIVVVLIVAVVLATGGGGNRLGDGYFKSDGSKYVLTFESDEIDVEEEDVAYVPLKTHIVYDYSGDAITGVKTYYEYADEATAKGAFDEIMDEMNEAGEDVNNLQRDGKYVIIVATEDQYADMTASDVKEQIEFMEQLRSMNSEGSSTESEVVESTN